MVVWSDWLSYASDALGVTDVQAGAMLSMIVTFIIVAGILIATRGAQAQWTVPLGFFFPTIFFTYIGWYNQIMGSVLAFIIGIFIAYRVASGLSGNGQ